MSLDLKDNIQSGTDSIIEVIQFYLPINLSSNICIL